MKDNVLDIIINYFDNFVHNIDFANLPEKDSEEYRQLILKTANDQIFCNGRYSNITESTLEWFNEGEDGCYAVRDLAQINALSNEERTRLRFYLDLKDVCHPLFKGQKVDWTQWPWNMKSSESSMFNDDLWNFIAHGEYVYLRAAVEYDLMRLFFQDETFFTSIARSEIAQKFQFSVSKAWKENGTRESRNGGKSLEEEVYWFADNLWAIENHMLVGRELGFDYVEQSVYDAIDGCISSQYEIRQVKCSREMGAWIKENMTIGEEHPGNEKLRAMERKFMELFDKYDIRVSDFSFTWDLITIDLLGVALTGDDEDTPNPETDENDDLVWTDED